MKRITDSVKLEYQGKRQFNPFVVSLSNYELNRQQSSCCKSPSTSSGRTVNLIGVSPSVRTSSLVGLSLFLWLAFAAFPVWPAEWSAEPSVVLRQEYNDNINLTALPHNAVWGSILTPSIKLSSSTEVSQTSASVLLNLNRYTGATGLDRNDQFYTLSSNYKTERDVWAGDFSYTRDSTLSSELSQTGIVLTRAQRSLLSLAPSWTRMLSERTSLKLGYQFNNVGYAGGTAFGLVDYTNHAVEADWMYQATENDLVNMSVSYSRFQTANASYTANTVGVQGGLTHSFSETMKGTVLLGVNQSKSTLNSQSLQLVSIFPLVFTQVQSTQTSSNLVPVVSATLNKQFETGSINGSASRQLVPGGNGSLVETDRLGLGATHSFNERLTGSVNGAVYRSRYIGDAVSAASSRYYELVFNLDWQMSERWKLESGYRYARVTYQNSSVAPVSNLIYASIRYDWPKISVSR